VSLVGIIANPAAGKDIRRLVAGAMVIDNQTKVGMIYRLLVGLNTMGVDEAAIMPDEANLGAQAIDRFTRRGDAERRCEGHLAARVLHMPWSGGPEDSRRAAHVLHQAGAGCIITLGGDGTVRIVSRGAETTPLLAVSTGTNNVLPSFVEPTIAGMAAGAVATKRVPLQEAAARQKWIEVQVDDGRRDRALVDAALVRGLFVGTRAVWRGADLRVIVVTRADPASAGLSALVGAVAYAHPDHHFGLVLRLRRDGARTLCGLLSPGLPVELAYDRAEQLPVGQSWSTTVAEPMLVTLDGEREIALHPGQTVTMSLRDDGPWLVDARRALRRAAQSGQWPPSAPRDSTHNATWR